MATNKRKDAAALFELIDKSTLKVPKSGSLRIPSWWSSKTNTAGPSTSGGPSRVGVGVENEDGGVPVAAIAPVVAGKAGVTSGGGTTTGTGLPPGAPKKEVDAPKVDAPKKEAEDRQHRLFDPPPAEAEVTASPTIRPPVSKPVEAEAAAPLAAAATEAVEKREIPAVAGAAATAPTIKAEAPKPLPPSLKPGAVAARMSKAAEGAAGSGARRFAPQTMDQGAVRQAWNPPTLARVPGWALLGGAAVAVIILVLVIILALPRGGVKGTGPVNPVVGGGDHTKPGPRDPTDPRNLTTGAGGGNVNATQRSVPPDPTAKVWEPGTLRRDPKLYYVWVIGTPKEDMARKDAGLLAANGIGASIERQQTSRGETLFQVITEQGFASTKEAEGYIKKIRDIGKTKPEYRKTRRPSEGWQDAYAQPVKPPSR